MKNIFVGNLPYSVTQDDLRAAFEQFGTVERVSIMTDRDTGQPRGFAFVEMSSGDEANAAINGMNGRDLNGRTLNVSEARPREERGGSGGGYRSSGGGGGGRREPRW